MSKYNSQYTGQEIDAGIRPYKIYTALLTQSGADAPSAVVLENNLGVNVSWVRNLAGSYKTSNIFVQGKAAVVIGSKDIYTITAFFFDDFSGYQVHIRTRDTLGGDALADNCLSDTFVEIRIYP